MAKKKNVKHIMGGGMFSGFGGDIIYQETSERVVRKLTDGHVGANAVTWQGWADHMEGGPAPYTDFNYKIPGTNQHYKEYWGIEDTPSKKKKITRESRIKKFPQRQAKKAQGGAFKKRGYVSSYLDLTVNTPGKYGIDY